MKPFRTAAILLLAAAVCGFRGALPWLSDGKNSGIDLEAAVRRCGWEMQQIAPEVLELAGAGETVRLAGGSAAAVIGGVRTGLLKPVIRLADGRWMMDPEDLEHTLQPLLTNDAVPDTPVRKIVIDAGHGGTDPGARGGGLEEKDVNLDLAKRIAKVLEADAMQVVMTRSSDVFLPLARRADQVRTENADLYISIHQNSARNRQASGVECFWSPRNRYAGASLRLAWEIQAALLDEFDASGTGYDRGVKRADFRVIRSADCPAVLLECGFISNQQDRQRMTEEDYLDDFARAAADGIMNYCRIRETEK